MQPAMELSRSDYQQLENIHALATSCHTLSSNFATLFLPVHATYQKCHEIIHSCK